jgi:hypothetical protein
VLECMKEEGVQVVSVATVSASSWRWPAFPARDRGAGELDLEWKRRLSIEKKREMISPIDGNLQHCRRSSLARALSNGEKGWSPWQRGSAVREGVEGKQMSDRGELQRGCWALYGRGGLGVGCTSSVTVGREGRHFWDDVVS